MTRRNLYPFSKPYCIAGCEVVCAGEQDGQRALVLEFHYLESADHPDPTALLLADAILLRDWLNSAIAEEQRITARNQEDI